MEFRNEIRSVDDWFKVAPPKGKDKQWKDGYSAKELAKYIVEENIAKILVKKKGKN